MLGSDITWQIISLCHFYSSCWRVLPLTPQQLRFSWLQVSIPKQPPPPTSRAGLDNPSSLCVIRKRSQTPTHNSPQLHETKDSSDSKKHCVNYTKVHETQVTKRKIRKVERKRETSCFMFQKGTKINFRLLLGNWKSDVSRVFFFGLKFNRWAY